MIDTIVRRVVSSKWQSSMVLRAADGLRDLVIWRRATDSDWSSEHCALGFLQKFRAMDPYSLGPRRWHIVCYSMVDIGTRRRGVQ